MKRAKKVAQRVLLRRHSEKTTQKDPRGRNLLRTCEPLDGPSCYTPSKILEGSSRYSLTRTRKLTDSLPSTMRWS